MHINFELDSSPSTVTLPLYIVVVGVFAFMDDTQPVEVDKDRFPDVIRKYAGELLFEVPNHLAGHPQQLCINLHITDLTGFTPAGLTAQIPELGPALAFRGRLAALADGSLSYDQFETKLHCSPGATTPSILFLCHSLFLSEIPENC